MDKHKQPKYSDQKRKDLFNGTALDYVLMRADKHEKVYAMPKQAQHLRKLVENVVYEQKMESMAFAEWMWANVTGYFRGGTYAVEFTSGLDTSQTYTIVELYEHWRRNK